MKLEIDIPEHHYNSIIAFDSVSLGRVPYKGIIMYAINAIKRGKALEQEPTTKNDLGVDCVARQDVERYIEGFINEYTPKEELEFINLELDGLKYLPPATPQEQKTGRWITRPHVYGVTYCSECDFELKIDNTNYCPNCGCRIVETQESEKNMSKHWIDDADHWICPDCGFITGSPSKYEGCKCPKCGFQDEKDRVKSEDKE